MTREFILRGCWLLGALGAVAVGCGRSGAPAAPPAAPTGGGATVATAAADQAPPHVFTARPHRPRVRTAVPPPPSLGSLPALVDETARCFEVERPREVRPPPWARAGGSPGAQRPAAKSGFGAGSGRTLGSGAGAGGGLGLGSIGSGAADAAGPSRRVTGATQSEAKAPPPAPQAASAPAAPSQPRDAAPATPKKKDARDSAGARRSSEGAAVAEQEAPRPGDDAPAPPPTIAADDDRFNDWGQAIYLSNDDTMSLSSAQRVMFAIDGFLPLPAEHIRPHEMLNYFSFDTAEVPDTDDFSVDASIAEKPGEAGIYSLALAVSGRPVSLQTRRHGNIAFVIDRSGSMSAEGRMEYLKRGLLRSLAETKTGDVLHFVLFDHEVCTPIKNFVVGRDSTAALERMIRAFRPRGSTDVHAGLREGYAVADAAYRPEYTNRLVLITDALANTGVTDHDMIATIGKFHDTRRIRLSGVGVGREFNDALLDRLTERGKGAYVFLGSEAEVDAVFGSRFISLIETTASDVHFRLHLPPSLRMNVFYGEEASVVKEDVQAIHYFANTSQLFLSDLMAKGGRLRPQDGVMLTVEYEHPETGDEMVEEYAFRLGDIARESRNVKKGRLVMAFVDGLASMASRPDPERRHHGPAGWLDEGAFSECEAGRAALSTMARGVDDDPEVRRVLGLWEKYCSRYERPRGAVRPTPDRWPGASGG